MAGQSDRLRGQHLGGSGPGVPTGIDAHEQDLTAGSARRVVDRAVTAGGQRRLRGRIGTPVELTPPRPVIGPPSKGTIGSAVP